MSDKQIIDLPAGVSAAYLAETIRALQASGGGTIKLPAGEWIANEIVAALQEAPRVRLNGQGRGVSVLKWQAP